MTTLRQSWKEQENSGQGDMYSLSVRIRRMPALPVGMVGSYERWMMIYFEPRSCMDHEEYEDMFVR